jgi:hypothetical protein
MKICSKCKIEKEELYFHKDSNRKDKLTTQCKLCVKIDNKKWYEENKDRVKKIRLEYEKDNKSKITDRRLKRVYNINLDIFEKILKSQDNKCAICKNTFTEYNIPRIDHDHSCCYGKNSCGKCIRGLLCFKCNVGIGALNDCYKLLNEASNYLKGYSSGK